MKKVILTLVIGLMTIVGYGQVVKVNVTKRQSFEHSSSISSQYAGENNLMTYIQGGSVLGFYTFDLDNNLMSLEYFDKNDEKFIEKYPIIEKYKTTNLVDVLIVNEKGEEYLVVLGNTVKDNSYVLIIEKKEGDKIVGSFYPDCVVEIVSN